MTAKNIILQYQKVPNLLDPLLKKMMLPYNFDGTVVQPDTPGTVQQKHTSHATTAGIMGGVYKLSDDMLAIQHHRHQEHCSGYNLRVPQAN